MSTIVEPKAIDAYVAAVENALGPTLLVEHRELVEDLVEHLTELSAPRLARWCHDDRPSGGHVDPASGGL